MGSTHRSLTILISLVATVVSLSLAVPAAAQGDDEDEAPPTAEHVESPVPELAAKVLRRMHLINQFEITAGKLAMERGSHEKVRALGERLMRDHRIADDKVTEMAAQLNFAVPEVRFDKMMDKSEAKLSGPKQMLTSALEKLRTAEGAKFDRAYVRAMAKTHRRAIEMLDTKVLELDIEPLRALVEDLLPILGQHRELARVVREELDDESET